MNKGKWMGHQPIAWHHEHTHIYTLNPRMLLLQETVKVKFCSTGPNIAHITVSRLSKGGTVA